MTEEKIDLAVIPIHYSARIAIDEVCHTFVQKHPFQSFLFSDDWKGMLM